MAGKISEDSAATTLVGVQYAGIQDGRNVRVPQTLLDAEFMTSAEVAASYQPLDADLTAIAALTTTSFGRGLLTETSATTARTTLGVAEVFDTIALAEAYAPISAPDTIQTRGYAAAGDGGAALYKKAASEPSHAGKFSITLSDGVTVVWYELAERTPYAEMFGVVGDYDPTDGSGTDNTAAFVRAFGFAPVICIGPGLFKCANMVDPPIHGGLIGPAPLGKITEQTSWDDLGANFAILVPTNGGARTTYTIDADITSAGIGTLANPAAAEAYTANHGGRSSHYELLDFTNQDADAGTTAATARAFTAAYKHKRGGVLINIGIRPPKSNTLDYAADTAFADDIDIGVWAENDVQSTVQGCAVVGDFRMVGFFKGVYDSGDGLTPEGDRAFYSNNHFQGHTGVSYRTPNVHRVIAADATTVTLPWNQSHRFAATGTLKGDSFSGEVAYTSVARVSDTLVFTCSTDPTSSNFAAGEACYIKTPSFGMAETVMTGCFIRDLGHPSFWTSTSSEYDTPFNRQGKGIEISGLGCRGLKFYANTIHVRDDVARWFGVCSDIATFGGYIEAKFNADGDNAVRDIALSDAALEAGIGGVTYPAGEAGSIRDYGIDNVLSQYNRKPMIDHSSSKTLGRFGTTGGLFDPFGMPPDEYTNAFDTGGALTLRAPRTRASTFQFKIMDEDNNVVAGFLRTNKQWQVINSQKFNALVDFDFADPGFRLVGDTGTWHVQNLDADGTFNMKFSGGTVLGFETTGRIRLGGSTAPSISQGTGTPEGVVTARIGSTYHRADGGAGTSFYVKESGTGNTGWVAK